MPCGPGSALRRIVVIRDAFNAGLAKELRAEMTAVKWIRSVQCVCVCVCVRARACVRVCVRV